jgi:VWFA-related protein
MTATKTNPGMKRSLISALTAALLAIAMLIGGVAPALAQQGTIASPPPIVMPGSQGKETSTLELPSMPAPQGGGALNIPPQVPQTGQSLEVPTRQLRQQPGYEQVTVTVTEPSGTYVTGLQKDDFKLYMDGQQRPIEFFRQDLNTPVSVGILVDTSGSMTPKIPQARAAIAEFLRDLNDKDDVFLFAFSSHPFLLQPFTVNHDLVMRRLALLHAYGQTALFDVIMEGLQMVQRGRYDKKALLVVTDGMDNTSASTVNDVVAQARRMGVLVYSIGIGDPNGGNGGISVSIGPFVLGGDDSEHVDAETLHTLSTETGAKTYIIREAGADTAACAWTCPASRAPTFACARE